MTTWRRSPGFVHCGSCGEEIPREQPMLELTVECLSAFRIRFRCRGCAGDAVPTDLPALPIAAPLTPLPMTRFTPGMLPIDFKQKASGE